MRKLVVFIAGLMMVVVSIRAQVSPIRILALGDSYTIGESVAESERWPVILASRLEGMGLHVGEVKIIAKTGWRTDQLMEAIDQAGLDHSWDWVSLLIGVNNQYQGRTTDDYEEEFPELLEKAIDLAGGRHDRVFVLSIPDYAFTPFGQEKYPSIISSELRSFNRINRIITKRYQVKYVNITDITKKGIKQPELLANDGLHPSGLQYEKWVDLIIKELGPNFRH